MSPQTDSTAGDTITVRIPTGEEVYNHLMQKIEPDLLTKVIPTLDAKYNGETAADHAARMERYKRAYAAYDAAFEEWSNTLQKAVRTYRKSALKIEEKKEHAAEEAELHKMEELFNPPQAA